MFKVFLVFILCFFFFTFYWSSSMRVAYPTRYIFGLKGSGKTTFFVRLMLKDLKNGFTVYTNIHDINIPGVRVFDVSDLGKFVPVPHSSVYIDEAALSYNNRDFKKFSSDMLEFICLVRHYKCKLTLNSQAFDVDVKIRDRVDQFFFVRRLGCYALVRPIVRRFSANDKTSENDSPVLPRYEFGGLLGWRVLFIPRYWKFFDSFSVSEKPDLKYNEVVGAWPDSAVLKNLNKLKKKLK